jgi:type IV pilus assembly protein PilO
MAITINDIKKLSPKVKALIIILVIILIGYFDWFYFLSAAMDKKASLDQKLEELQSQIKEKERSALQFNKYKAEVAVLRDSYKIALQKLPDQREIPGLFHSISLAGKDAGIEFLLFEPKAAIPKSLDKQSAKEESKTGALLKPSDQKQTPDAKPGDKKKTPELETFYEEIPVNVIVVGTFQNTVYFFEKVAKLPRIVNISDINMGERKDVKGRGYVINTSCTVKTYMFVDKKESVSEKTK